MNIIYDDWVINSFKKEMQKEKDGRERERERITEQNEGNITSKNSASFDLGGVGRGIKKNAPICSQK